MEKVLARFDVPYRHLTAGSEETSESQGRKTVSGPRFETRTSRIRDRYEDDSIRNHVLRLLNYVARLPVRVLYYIPHTLESRTRKYCFCCVRMCESILKAWQQQSIEEKLLLPHTDNTLYLYSRPYVCGTICGEVCTYCMAKN
jgi:hypothetical protein